MRMARKLPDSMPASIDLTPIIHALWCELIEPKAAPSGATLRRAPALRLLCPAFCRAPPPPLRPPPKRAQARQRSPSVVHASREPQATLWSRRRPHSHHRRRQQPLRPPTVAHRQRHTRARVGEQRVWGCMSEVTGCGLFSMLH